MKTNNHMTNPFQLNPDEAILYRSQPSRTWYMLAGRIGLGIIEVLVFIFLSFVSFTGIAGSILATFLPPGLADGLSRVIFQGLAPILVVAWFAEDTVRIFTSELILTNQRLWIKGSPYAWTPGHDTPLSEIKSLSARREAVFMRLNDSRKVEVLVFPHGKQIVDAYTQFMEEFRAA